MLKVITVEKKHGVNGVVGVGRKQNSKISVALRTFVTILQTVRVVDIDGISGKGCIRIKTIFAIVNAPYVAVLRVERHCVKTIDRIYHP